MEGNDTLGLVGDNLPPLIQPVADANVGNDTLDGGDGTGDDYLDDLGTNTVVDPQNPGLTYTDRSPEIEWIGSAYFDLMGGDTVVVQPYSPVEIQVVAIDRDGDPVTITANVPGQPTVEVREGRRRFTPTTQKPPSRSP